jgi:hypothetical protein
VGSFIFLRLSEYTIEHNFEEALKKGELKSKSIIEFTSNELDKAIWQSNSEIEMDGRYYDLVAIRDNETGQPIYEFIADEEETELFYKFKLTFNNSNNAKKAPPIAFFFFCNLNDKSRFYTNYLIRDVITLYKVPKGESYLKPLFSPPKA